ncbi:hypothetical protein TEA_022995 [Camellia sinensis var. sinensis]|uniref:Metal-nicotianamine transporter YSL1 n=1 Tax=Camellia sinensis var. sinensis TaxID=542762 RepID=A0A4S4E8Q4_CAMSN|nr:hypothetical protein TEA_022995 [Camellia sinensis var. sinensis]
MIRFVVSNPGGANSSHKNNFSRNWDKVAIILPFLDSAKAKGSGGSATAGSGAAPRRGRGAAPPKQNAKMHSKLPVRSSGHSPARAENAEFLLGFSECSRTFVWLLSPSGCDSFRAAANSSGAFLFICARGQNLAFSSMSCHGLGKHAMSLGSSQLVTQILIIDYNLTYPSGVATAALINGFHNQGEKTAKKQVRGFTKFFSMSFLWAFFKWLYTGKEVCGFQQFPTFGLKAWRNTFYFDFSMTYVGTGMICSPIVNISTLLGAVISWGIMWPLMGDGLYSFVKIICITFLNVHVRFKQRNINPAAGDQNKSRDELKKNEIFIRESIPMWIGASGYGLFIVISAIAIPFIFPELKWYFVILAYIFAPALAFCNAYGAGLTDINMAFNYGKVGLFILAALAGKEHGVVAGLAGCGLIKSVISVSCLLMQDLKTGHLTLTSPRAMLVNQAIGTAIGCIVSPLSFFLFYKAFNVGDPNGEYKAPFAIIYRNMAILAVEGLSALPNHCLQLCGGFFAFAVGINLVKDICPPKIGKWMPLPMAMAVPFLSGGYFAVDLCVGTLVVIVWQKINPKKAELMVPVVASGLICGEGLWILPASVLSLAKIYPPMCMSFSAS